METLEIGPEERASTCDDGFTLIELLIVIVILGILSAVVVIAVGGITDRGEDSACESDERAMRTAAEAYYAQEGEYPADEGALVPGFLSEPSDLHAYAVSGTTFTITGTGDCA